MIPSALPNTTDRRPDGSASVSMALLHPAVASANSAMAALRQTVLKAVSSPHTRRNYAKALDEVSAFSELREQPLSRDLLMEYRDQMIARKLSPSTINVRLSAVRKLIGEAKRNGILGVEQAAQMADVPNVRQQGTRLGNWLTLEQAKALLTVPDRVTLKGKRDAAILALLVGCALRRAELAALKMENIQQREGRWVIADLSGKGGRIRTVAIPMWVKLLMDTWTSAAGLSAGRMLRPVNKSGCVAGEELSVWAVWSAVETSAKAIGIERFGADDLRRTCAKLCRKNGGDLEQIKLLLGHASIQTTERYLGSEQETAVAVNDNLGL